MLARSPNSTGILVIAAVSGRALAQAARRAGFRARVADFFCDDDTVEAAEQVVKLPGDLHSGVDADRLVETLRGLLQLADVTVGYTSGPSGQVALVPGPLRTISPPSPPAVILGSGFERLPDLIDEIARHFPLTGNDGAAIRRVKDPRRLAADCRDLGIPHPELRWQEPTDPANWLVKSAGGAGGTHIRQAKGGAPVNGRYFQRLVHGDSISALFVADRRKAHIVGFSRQWTSPAQHAPYRYGGAVRLRRFPRKDSAGIADWLSGLTARAGLVGLCSADLIRNETGYTLIEINPRPGATLDLFDGEDAPLLTAHVSACRGEPFTLPRFDASMASMIAYADQPIAAFPRLNWPGWTADHQSAGTRLEAGDPVCTVFGRGRSAALARRRATANLRQMERAWGGGCQ